MLFFIDESGTDLNFSPCMVLAAISVREQELWEFVQKFEELKQIVLHIPRKWEAKGEKLLKKKVFKIANQMKPIEQNRRDLLVHSFHEKNILKKNLKEDELVAYNQAKLDFTHKILELCESYKMKVFASIVSRVAPKQRGEYLRKDFSYLFQRIYAFLSDFSPNEKGIIVFDEVDKKLSNKLISQMEQYFKDTVKGRTRGDRIIPSPFFVHSDLTPVIQVIDIIAYTICWGLRFGRMSEPKRDELGRFADTVFKMSYVRSETIPLGGFARNLYGICYITDLRPRSEIEEDEDGFC